MVEVQDQAVSLPTIFIALFIFNILRTPGRASYKGLNNGCRNVRETKNTNQWKTKRDHNLYTENSKLPKSLSEHGLKQYTEKGRP